MYRGLQPGISTMAGWGLSMFTDDELTELHLATLDILQNYGVGVHCDEAMDIFENGGAYVDREKNHVRIPPPPPTHTWWKMPLAQLPVPSCWPDEPRNMM